MLGGAMGEKAVVRRHFSSEKMIWLGGIDNESFNLFF
jgi:hypothetical protein